MTDQQRGPFTDLHSEFKPRKLDVLAALREAYKGAWEHLGEMIRLIWLPVVLNLVVSTVSILLPVDSNLFLSFLLSATSMFLWAIISVAWYRFILLNEKPSGSFQINFGRREGRYLFLSVALMLLALPSLIFAPDLPWSVAMAEYLKTAGSAASLVSFFGLMLALVGLYFLIRLFLLLPAVSIDEPLNVRLILERTRGNFWRIVLLSVLSSLPVLIIYALIIAMSNALNLPETFAFILQSVVSIFFAIVNIAVLAIAYRELIGPKGAMAQDLDRPDAF
ncbi:MAG: hypothetical protein ACOH12_08085 [Parvibaculaceae bacterium]